ncbi:MAG TPA: pectate lyase, partial [Gemmatimonadaceae bacterium]
VPRELWREPPNIPLVTSERIAKYVPTAKAEWEAYLVRSRELRMRDTASMRKELRAAGATKMTQAPYTHDFALTDSMTAAWFATDAARRIVDNILTYQAPNGGWSKHVDFRAHARRPAESYFGEGDQWEWISTIDNFSTTEEIRFLARANAARRVPRYEAAVSRGVGYLLSAQYPNGCFPQVYPLQGGYHDAATYNDDATVHVLRVLRETTRGAFTLKAASGAGPLWGRLYEIGTNLVIMANRDGVKRYDWNALTDRRSGYRWYVTEPAQTIAAYDAWASKVHK